ncbi:hypothetical protein U3516DRAFT_736019 [Neocallimastix sp. 'constans']
MINDRKSFIYSASFDLHYLTVSSKALWIFQLKRSTPPLIQANALIYSLIKTFSYRVFHLTAALPDGRLSR